MNRWFQWLLLAAALPFCGCFTRPSSLEAPGYRYYTLAAEQTWRMNLPRGERFDASGLYLDKSGELLTESDQRIGVYRVRFPADNGDSVDLIQQTNCYTPAQLASLAIGKHGRFDCEGITEDDQGRIYLCEEGDRMILRYDPQTRTVENLNIDWSPVRKYFSDDRNAAWEGITIHGSTIYIANERKKGRIIVVNMNTLKVIDDFVLPASWSWWFWDTHYSDLCWFDGALYALLREDHVILKIDPQSKLVLAEYNFHKMENASENLYLKKYPIGVMEGLAVDKHYFWLCTDNNGYGRAKYPNDTRPALFKCPRPDTPRP